ncbi:MAG: DUF262 domain-containing protein [Planctomycetota bacterium]|nr:MAG: DUF262 domain-containing protein [Planctomycetota bacterium]
MAFQTPITIKEALDAIQRQDYVLPAIQREFTWDTEQICGLFDSLMQGYPIGSFLFWRVEPGRIKDYTWYGFMREFHEKNRRHCPVLDVPLKPVVAILDGQQRLTSLNIGLRGYHAEKEPRKRWDNPDAFPTKYLYLNLLSPASENERGLKYDFRFLTPGRAESERSDTTYWFKVSQVFDFKEDFDVILALQTMRLAQDQHAARVLNRLYGRVHREALLPYFDEKEQDLDKVLNIFIRVNSAGDPLTYSDLLLSIATAQWKDRDARQAIHTLVDELNGIRAGFGFSKDLVLKASLMLSDIQSVAFRVTNFNATNMKTLAKNWEKIDRALRLSVELLAQFGFSGQTLTADSVVIPVAYYVCKRAFDESYLSSPRHRDDRELLRGWVCRSLVKAGVWGSGLDTLLLALRTSLQERADRGFPIENIEAAMAKRGKSIRFTEEEIEDLLDIRYGDKRTFAILALLFPHVDVRNVFHVDHVFPKARFTPTRLRTAGISEEQRDDYIDKCERLANLQLLEGPANESKRAKLPNEWLSEKYPARTARANFCELHELGVVPEAMRAFDRFYTSRRKRLADRLRRILSVAPEAGGLVEEQ